MPIRSSLIFALSAFWISTIFGQTNSLRKLETAISDHVEDGRILGAQLIVGQHDKLLLERSFGIRSANDPTAVDSTTQFCIGSCSKPFASATILSLVQSEHLDLDTPISSLLPEFESLKIKNEGLAKRSPSLRELLCHRGGIYSQKQVMNRRQGHWIRDFKLTLEDAVKGIAGESLISAPGTDYAYSGAGYCVIGRVAEAGMNQSFESIFQRQIGA